MTSTNPLEAALQQLAQTMGVALGGAALPSDVHGEERAAPAGRHAGGSGEASEEGELEDSTLPSKRPPAAPPVQRRMDASKRTRTGAQQPLPGRAPERAHGMDAESILRGGSAARPATASRDGWPFTHKAASDPTGIKYERKVVAVARTARSTSATATAGKSAGTTAGKDAGSGPAAGNSAVAGKVPCRYWMEGKCSKGDSCTFSHLQRPNKTAEEAKSGEVCRFHISGSCLKGDACLFSHDLSKVPCKFFHAIGECSARRTTCRFSHEPISAEERRALFAESTGARDPRLPPAAGGAPDGEQRPFVPAAVPAAAPAVDTTALLTNALEPAVRAFNPYGSPF